MNDRVIVTGATGFLGSAVCSALDAQGIPVCRWGWNPEARRNGDLVELDMTRAEQVRTALAWSGPASAVIHLAGHVDIQLEPDLGHAERWPRPGPEDAARLWDVNVMATVHLIEALLASGAPRLMFASSQSVYGMPAESRLTEESPVRPLEHYAASKRAAEIVLEIAARRGLPVTVFRFPGLYAEDRASGVVARWCQQAATGKPLAVESSFPLPFDVIHRDDVVACIIRRLAQAWTGYQLFNVASGAPCSLTRLADEIAQLAGVTVEHREVPQPDVCLDAGRAKREIGWVAVPRRERLQGLLNQEARRAG